MQPGYAGRSLSRRTALELGSAGLALLLAARRSVTVAAEESSPSSRQREIVQRLFTDGVNTGDEALITSLYAPMLAPDGAGASALPAPAGMPIPLHAFRLAAPDVRASVDALVAEGDLVAALITWRGPHPPAGTHIEGTTMHLFRIEREQVTEQWSVGWEWLEDEWRQEPSPPANPLATS